MQFETCQIGGALRLGDDARIVIHRRQGERIVLGASAPVGSGLIFERTPVCSISGAVGIWSDLFSLQAIRRFTLGRFEVRVWLRPTRCRLRGFAAPRDCRGPPVAARAFARLASIQTASRGPAAAATPPVPGRWRVPAPSLERLNACH